MTTFIEPNLEVFLSKLNQLSEDKNPEWGAMNAQQMVEHLSTSVAMSFGKFQVQLSIPEDKVEKALLFLDSDKPMPRGFKVNFAPENPKLRFEDMPSAIDELCENWAAFETYYQDNPDGTNLHPVYGHLAYEKWLRVHSKHFTHHFEQFGL